MPNITLYLAPGSCSRVPLVALLEAGLTAGVDFDTRIVRFQAGDHRSPEFTAINPNGKVPVLIVDGAALTENVAILGLLAARFPGLQPPASTPIDAARQVADLCFCAATLHPLVTRIRMPIFFATPDAVASVRARGSEAMAKQLAPVERRLADGRWWYRDHWSVVDAYLHWVCWRIEGAGFVIEDFPQLAEHGRRMRARPSFAQALAIETAADTGET